MKKLTWAVSKTLIGKIAPVTCLTAATAGVVFGVAGATFKIEYMTLNDADMRLNASLTHNYYSQNISSQWNMNAVKSPGEEGYIPGIEQPYTKAITNDWWIKAHHQGGLRWDAYDQVTGIDPVNGMGRDKKEDSTLEQDQLTKDEIAQRKKYASLVIDGATHTALDRSFNQGLYNGIANFVYNKHHVVNDDSEAQIYKPSQDNTQEFLNIYRAVAAKTRILSLAGFNHVTPLNALGTRADDGTFHFNDDRMANTGLMLMDGDVPNNQNIVSVLFRSDQPAFLTAIATAMYFYNNLHLYHDKFQDLRVGMFGGAPIPTVTIYMGGYQRGIEFVNEFILNNVILAEAKHYMNNDESTKYEGKYFVTKLLPASKYKDEVNALKEEPESAEKTTKVNEMLNKLYDEYSIKPIKLGSFDTHFTGTFVSGDGIGISKQFLNRGASAIIVVAGPQSMDAAQEVMNQGSKCIVIGVDSAMETSDYQKPFGKTAFADKSVAPDNSKPNQATNIIKFSAVKDMTEVSDQILRLACTGEHWTVENSEPWNSPSAIPSYSTTSILPTEYLQCVREEGSVDEFAIIGFSKSPAETKCTVLNLPTTWVDPTDGTTCHLSRVGKKDGETPTLEFNDTTLKPFTTLKLEEETDKIVIFQDKAFNFNKDSQDYNNSGFKYIDFSANKSINVYASSYPFGDLGKQEGCRSYQRGIVKFSKNLRDVAKSELYTLFFGNSNWGVVEADPLKSVCSFGFKTCGNIENGLISISFDGWYYLLEGLRQIDVLLRTSGSPVAATFMEAWEEEANSYVLKHSDLPDSFKNAVVSTDYKTMSTFDNNSVIKQYYSHVMAILGQVFKNWGFTFGQNMTIVFDDDGNPQKAPTTGVPMSILDWLRTNMYYTI